MGVTYGVGEEKGKGAVIHTANHPDPYCGSCIFRLGDQASKGKKGWFLYSNKLRQADEQRV